MPELPEVESIRRSLEPKIVGRRVIGVTLHRRDMVVAPGDPYGGFSRQRSAGRREVRPRRVGRADLLLDAVLTGVLRHGKQLAIVGERTRDGAVVAVGVQLGMSGQLFHRAPGQRVPHSSHVHAVWRFEDGRLVFRDPRRFGGLRVFPSAAAVAEHWRGLGPDALALTPEELSRALCGSERAIKTALLDQAVVAGVGNIYADEALFAAGVRPTRPCADLSITEIRGLAACISTVLRAAVEAGGSTLRDYVDANGDPGTYQLAHAVYGRAGRPCPRCGRPLCGGTVSQRTTVWCADCQR